MNKPYAATGAWRLFQLLLLASATWAVIFARSTLGPLQEAMRVDLMLSDNQIAWLLGPAVAIPLALASIPMGLLIDRYSRARLFVFFITLNFAATLLTALTSNLAMLFAARCLTGLALAAILVAAYSMVGDLYPPAQRGRATMVVAIGETGGAPAAFALGGLLLTLGNSIVLGADMASWRWALLWMCVPLLPVVVLMFMLREPPRTGVIVEKPPLREVWPELWRFRGVVVPLLLARIMVWIAEGSVLVWGAPTFERSFGMPADRIGAVMASALLISSILGPLLGGPLADLCQRTGGPRRTMTALCVLALFTAPASLFAVMPSTTTAIIALTTLLTLTCTIGVSATTLATIVIPGELRGLYLAVTISVGGFFCFGVAPLVVSSLSTVLGGPLMVGKALAFACVSTSVLGTLVFGIGRRNFSTALDAVDGAQTQPTVQSLSR